MHNKSNLWRLLALLTSTAAACFAQTAISSSYTQDFNSLGTALPDGWNVWLSSTATSNGTPFAWDPTPVANNATATAGSYFRNLPGAGQTWSLGNVAGADRALGWRAGSASSRDGSITFTLQNTLDANFDSLSFQLFTPNNSGTNGYFSLEYQLGTGTAFTPLNGVTYISDLAQNPLSVTTVAFTAETLSPLNNNPGPVTLRLNNLGTTGTSWNTVALDNFSYTTTSVPEPTVSALLAGGLALGITGFRRRRRSG